MHMLETKVTKAKVMLLGPPDRYSDRFLKLLRIFSVSRWSSVDIDIS